MKLAIVADVHFRGKDIKDKFAAWNAAVDRMIADKVKVLFLGGDTWDTRNIGGREASMGTVFRAFMDPLKRLLDAGIEVYAILGNHELATGAQMSALEPLKDTGVHVIDEMGGNYSGEGFQVRMIPWIPDKEGTRAQALKSCLKQIKKEFKDKKTFNILIGHLTVKGAAMNSGICLAGSEFEVSSEELEETGADRIFLGHIHKMQLIGKKVQYVGALCQNNFGEAGNPTGFMMIDTDKRTSTCIAIDSAKYHTIDIGKPNKAEGQSTGSGAGGEKADFSALDFPRMELVFKDLDRPEIMEKDYIRVRFLRKPTPEELQFVAERPNLSIEIVPERTTRARDAGGIEAGMSESDMLSKYLALKKCDEESMKRISATAEKLMEATI